MYALTNNLAVLLGYRLLLSWQVIVYPAWNYNHRLMKQKKSIGKHFHSLTQAENEFLMEPYDVQEAR